MTSSRAARLWSSCLVLALAGCPSEGELDDEQGETESTESTSSSTDSDTDSTTETSTSSDTDSSSESSTEDTETETDTSSEDSSDTTVEPYACLEPSPIFQAGRGEPSGFERCVDGFIHRVEAVEALDPAGPDTCTAPPGEFECASASDCTDQAHGRCLEPFPGETCSCDYGCASDADCEADEVCAPAGVVGERSTCVPAFDCAAQADCGEGLCGLSEYATCESSSFMLACADPDASCHVADDCPQRDEFCESPCVAHEGSEPIGAWACIPNPCDCAP